MAGRIPISDRSQSVLIACFVALLASRLVLANGSPVSFDVPAIAVAEPINPAVVEAPTTGGELIRLRISLSTMVAAGFSGSVEEYIVDIRSPGQSMRVLDLWPKDQLYSNVDGSISVEATQKSDSDFSFALSGAYEPIGRGSATGNYHRTLNSQERYARRPPMQILTSSGTSHRGYGVFFKFRPGPTPVLEGSREIAVLFEVPRGWRGDMLLVTMQASGRTASASGQGGKSLGSSQHWLATHREGDAVAAAQAQRYVLGEQRLRTVARQMESQIAARATPNVWRKLGAALNVVPPRIPDNYLAGFIFGPANPQFTGGTENLPVDLRVEVLDYWEQREQQLKLAHASSPSNPAMRSDEEYVALAAGK